MSDFASRRSNLEQLYGFDYMPFRQYMQGHGAVKNRAQKYLRLSGEMAGHPHPVVVYAAGWAAAEAVMHRAHPDRPYPLAKRLAALERAQALWSAVHPALEEAAQQRHTSPDLAASFFGLALRTKAALAYVPSMRLAAKWLAGFPLNTRQTESTLHHTEKKVTALGAEALGQTLRQERPSATRQGFCGELLAGLLIQKHRPPRHLIVPAALRQDHHPNPQLRGDLVAISANAEMRHPKTLIQIHDAQPRPGDPRFMIGSAALTLHRPGETILSTLQAFIDRANGVSKDMAAHESLDRLSGSLAGELAVFTSQQS
jgi:hypothetical protein